MAKKKIVKVRAPSADNYFGVWECDECGATVDWTYLACVEGGSPVCSKCDVDMEFTGKTGVWVIRKGWWRKVF